MVTKFTIIFTLLPFFSWSAVSLFFVLRNKHHPDLQLWACSGKRKDQDQIVAGAEKKLTPQDIANSEGKKHIQNHKDPPPTVEGTYITSEHSYQKPQSFSQGYQSLTEPGSSDDDDASSFEDDGELHMGHKSHFLYSAREHGLSEKVMVPMEQEEELVHQTRLVLGLC